MNKIVKKVMWIGALSTVGYAGFRTYQRVSAIAKLSKSLPEFLNNVYGEKPKINVKMDLSSIKISVGFKQDVIDDNEDIQTTVTEYITDFYPVLSKAKLKIDLFAVNFSETPKDDDCTCNCDENDPDCDCGDDCNCEDEEK